MSQSLFPYLKKRKELLGVYAMYGVLYNTFEYDVEKNPESMIPCWSILLSECEWVVSLLLTITYWFFSK